MSTLAVIGAGALGGAVAHAAARRDVFRDIRLIDDAADIAAGKALDLRQAGPIERFRTDLAADGRLLTAAGAEVIVLADPAAPADAGGRGTARASAAGGHAEARTGEGAARRGRVGGDVQRPASADAARRGGGRRGNDGGHAGRRLVSADAGHAVGPGPAAGPDAGPDGAGWDVDAGLARLRQLGAAARQAVVLCAGAGHRRLVERAVLEAGFDRRRVLGTAPDALRAALCALVALDARCAASAVALTVLGAPPDRLVTPWSQATIGGLSLEARLAPPRLTRLRALAPALWPPGPYALAAAAAQIAAALAAGTERRAACFVVADGELGVRGQALAAPVALAPPSGARIVEPSLTPRERADLESARTT